MLAIWRKAIWINSNASKLTQSLDHPIATTVPPSNPCKEIEITLNGQTTRIDSGCTVANLVRKMVKTGNPVAVERNAELVPGSEHQTTTLVAGDQLEVVSLTGGG